MIKNLHESVKMIAEESLPQKLEKALGIDSERANDIVKELGFTDYIELAAAVDSGDEAELKSILKGLNLFEDSNKVEVTDIRPGQEMVYKDDKGRETTVDLRDPDSESGLSVLDPTGNRAAVDDRGEDITPDPKEIERGDEFMVDLEEMQKLAGLDLNEATVRVYKGYGPTGGQMPFLNVNGRDIAFKIENRLHDVDIGSDGKGDMSIEDVTEIMRERGVSEEDIKQAFAELGMSIEETCAGAFATVAMPMGKTIKRKK